MQKLLVLAFCALAAAQFYGGYPEQQFYPEAMPMAAVDPYQQQQQMAMPMAGEPFPAAYPQYYPQFAQVPYGMMPQAEAAEEQEEEAVEEQAEEGEESEEEAVEGSFAETQAAGPKKLAKKLLKTTKKEAKKLAKAAKAGAQRVGKAVKNLGKSIKKSIKKGAKKLAKIILGEGKKKKRGPKTFKPLPVGKKAVKTSPSVKTPKAAGGQPLKPLPAPLPVKPKINCKKDPKKCLEAETPPEGHTPGDHSPTAIFKKKLENIKLSLMKNNRGIAQETKWIEEVEKIIGDYNKKVQKVKEHIADERKAIKELLRQRRLANNEKQQKELELKLKAATNELTSLTEALKQVQKKETELGKGKSSLKDKIKQLTADLKKLKGDNAADKKSTLKKK